MNIDWNSVRDVAQLMANVALLIVIGLNAFWHSAIIKLIKLHDERLTTLETAKSKRKMVDEEVSDE